MEWKYMRGLSVAKEDRPCVGENQGKTGEAYVCMHTIEKQ